MYNYLFTLCTYQPWLVNKREEVFDLLKLASEDYRIELILKLLREFTYVDEESLTRSADSIVDCITNEWKLPPKYTQIVASAYDDTADSSQAILWMLKRPFAEKGITDIRFVNRVGKAVGNVEARPFIVLIDEFIGTGQTLRNRIEWLQKNVSKELIERMKLSVCVVAAMENAIRNIENIIDRCHACIVLEKGIMKVTDIAERKKAYCAMYRMEKQLAERIEKIAIPHFGFGQAEALYYYQNGNPPNSNFPIFWWPEMKDGSARRTILTRMMNI